MLIGLTGGIGSGKSVVARMLEALGAAVVDADAIAREVVRPGEPALDRGVRVLGPAGPTPPGEADRPAPGPIVFPTERARTG
ncbi:MAG: dephospho-CoA kinase, partial [Bacillota bacterium]